VASDDNSGADGKNAALSYTAGASGTYFVRVLSAGNTKGEYVFSWRAPPAPCRPSTSRRLTLSTAFRTRFAPPTQMTVNFNDSILLTTLQAGDLTVDGVAASGYTLDSASEVTFYISAPTEGTHTIHIAAGAIKDLQGTPLDEFTATTPST